MYITVRLINGFKEPLIYKIPLAWPEQSLLGKVVLVPLQKRVERALVCGQSEYLPAHITYAIREAHSIELVPQDALHHSFLSMISDYYVIDTQTLYRRMRHSIAEPENDNPVVEQLPPISSSVVLTQEQQIVVAAVTEHISQAVYQPTLLQGVTGSGKTEVYKALIAHACTTGKTALVLLPEVSLAVNFYYIFKAAFGDSVPVYGFHSATPVKEKRNMWDDLMAGKPLIIVGVHMPVFLPIQNLGLIIIDEEHEVGFQEKKHPRINTKEAALMRARLYNVPIVLGSATPCMTSLYNVETRGWNLFQLTQRFSGAFPQISLVELKPGKRAAFWISTELERAIADRLAKQEQAIIFLNRRGYSFFVQCMKCNFIFSCTTCSVSLTYHDTQGAGHRDASYRDTGRLVCHYCGKNESLPAHCVQCKAPESSFLKKGIGTQQVVSILQKLFPTARIGRADADSTKNKKNWQETLTLFAERKLDILVGTQTITKGYHFPGVTLVGILWADINLHIPFYNAAEVTLQQLIQVAGRAGRACEKSEVIVQTFIKHALFNYLTEITYSTFYTSEIEKRALVQYPPLVRFAEIELRHANETTVENESTEWAVWLQDEIDRRQWEVTLLGPASPPVNKVQNVHIRKIYFKCKVMKQGALLFQMLKENDLESKLFFTPNPLS